MGTTLGVHGSLIFPRGALGVWQESFAQPIDTTAWPPSHATAAAESFDGPASVRELLAACRAFDASALGEGPNLLEVEVRGDTLRVRAVMSEDDFAEIGGTLLGLVGSAAARATGRVQIRDFGTLAGVAIVATAGDVAVESVGNPSPDDGAGLDELMGLARQRDAPSPRVEAKSSKGRTRS